MGGVFSAVVNGKGTQDDRLIVPGNEWYMNVLVVLVMGTVQYREHSPISGRFFTNVFTNVFTKRGIITKFILL